MCIKENRVFRSLAGLQAFLLSARHNGDDVKCLLHHHRCASLRGYELPINADE